jgi:hypothetical protein
MRCSLSILILSAGTLAFGQTGPSFPFSSGQPSQSLSPWNGQEIAPGPDFTKTPEWRWNPALSTLGTRMVLLPPPKSITVPLGDAAIDPQILRRPSPRDLGVQPPGTQIAQNLFPGLKFQPVDGQLSAQESFSPHTGPLPATWPQLNVHRIPTDWPKLTMGPVGGNSGPTIDRTHR